MDSDENTPEVPKKRTLSPEALEKLQEARKKALEIKKQNKLANDKMLLKKLVEKKEKDAEDAVEAVVEDKKKHTKTKTKKVKDRQDPEESTDDEHVKPKIKPKKVRNQTRIIIDNDSSSDSDDDSPVLILRTKKGKKKVKSSNPLPVNTAEVQELMPRVPIERVCDGGFPDPPIEPPPIVRQSPKPHWLNFK
tara:strand:- start:314 stop:889 length:576 start_codon:yes stop_codon:yes gene_type:complete